MGGIALNTTLARVASKLSQQAVNISIPTPAIQIPVAQT